MKVLLVVALLACSALAVPHGSPRKAEECNSDCINDPDNGIWCRCSGSNERPGGLPKDQIPQIVHLTFERGVTVQNYDLYQKIFKGRQNPNAAGISGTFFITHEYTDYYYVYQLWRQGHEIGLNSISFKPEQYYWKTLDAEGWYNEIIAQRQLIERLSTIPRSEIVGMRAPGLQLNGDETYYGVSEDLLYDSSRPTQRFRPNLWPYTADYLSTQDCVIAPCPEESYKGFWVSPLVTLLGDDSHEESFCTHINSCQPPPNTTDETYDLLMRNFEKHYKGSKTPFGLHATHSFFIDPVDPTKTTEVFEGYLKFIDEILTYPDVHIVSVKKGIDWMKNPQPLTDVDNIPSWAPANPRPDECDFPFSCHYTGNTLPEGFWGERRFRACNSCPGNYPWVGNPVGANPNRP